MKNRILELDALRGLAALSVLIFHYCRNTPIAIKFPIGCVGVDLFFIISGYVIVMSIDFISSWKQFFINRISRLYPTYLASLIITIFCIYLFNSSINFEKDEISNLWLKVAANLTMFQHLFKIGNIDGSYWTLYVEWNFYFFILILIFSKRVNKIVYYGIFILVFCVFYIVVSYKLNGAYLFRRFLWMFPIIDYFPLFFIGYLMYKSRFFKNYFYCHFLISFCFILQSLLYKVNYYNSSLITFNQYIFGLSIIYLLMMLFMFNKLQFIVNKVTIFIGSISYALYLLHQVIGQLIVNFFYLNGINNYFICILLSFLILIFLAFLVTKYIEIPSIRFIRSKVL